MAGILPMAKYKNEYYFLFGRERRFPKWKDSMKWSDFGGAIEKGESKMEAAIREGYEETNGLLGDLNDIKKLMNDHLVTVLSRTNYATFIVLVKYDEDLPPKFAEIYDNILNNEKHKLLLHDGKYEKDMAKWVAFKDLKKFKSEVRYFYRQNVDDIIRYFTHIKKL
jgi:8-oxo-dGTP pyrophosphatase MutT (NUDIX family)